MMEDLEDLLENDLDPFDLLEEDVDEDEAGTSLKILDDEPPFTIKKGVYKGLTLPRASGVKVTSIVQDQTPFRRRYEPSHPDADKDGFVSLPNVDTSSEMVDMLGAARAYQANLAAIGLIKEMVNKALELGR